MRRVPRARKRQGDRNTGSGKGRVRIMVRSTNASRLQDFAIVGRKSVATV
jgi:hypothetical protein